MKTFEVDLIQKEWFTVQVVARDEAEAREVAKYLAGNGVRIQVSADGKVEYTTALPEGVSEEAFDATLAYHDEETADDFWEQFAQETGYIEIDTGEVNEFVVR